METFQSSTGYFVGDFTDPWVAALVENFPREVGRFPVSESLPRTWPEEILKSEAVILHRPWLTSSDAERLQSLRGRPGSPPRVLLCTGLLPRYQQTERWVPLVDRIVSETHPTQLLLRWLLKEKLPVNRNQPLKEPRPTLAVVSRVHEIRQLMAEICKEAGFPNQAGREWCDVGPGLPGLWDVPILEPDWQTELRIEARNRPIIAVAGFLDRSLTTQMLGCGARACVDLPCDPDEICWLMESLSSHNLDSRFHSGHVQLPKPHPQSILGQKSDSVAVTLDLPAL